MGSAVVARVEGALEEMFGSGDWVDVMVRVRLFAVRDVFSAFV